MERDRIGNPQRAQIPGYEFETQEKRKEFAHEAQQGIYSY